MRQVSEAGFGTIENSSGSSRSLIFRKRPYSEMAIEQQKALKGMKILLKIFTMTPSWIIQLILQTVMTFAF